MNITEDVCLIISAYMLILTMVEYYIESNNQIYCYNLPCWMDFHYPQ